MKRIFAVLLALVLLCTFAPFAAAEDAPAEPATAEAVDAPAQAEQPADGLLEQLRLKNAARREALVGDPEVILSGDCGEGVTWQLDENFTLTIGGEGAIQTYSDYTAVPWYTFADMIPKIVVEDGVTNLQKGLFAACTAVESMTLGCLNVTIKNLFNDSVPLSLQGVTLTSGVTSIMNGAFSGCSSLTSILISDGVTSIGESAFSGCTGLTSIVIPNNVTSVEKSAFRNCTGLTNITIPDSVTSIKGYAFYGCTGLKSITIPEGVASIGNYAFVDCTSLTDVEIPDSVTLIEQNLFRNCSSLMNVTIGSGVTGIGQGAFYKCNSLTNVTIGGNVKSIGEYAFYNCSSLTSVVVPDSVTSISKNAFYGCTALQSITLPFIGLSKQTSVVDSEAAVFGAIFGYEQCNIQFGTFVGSEINIATVKTGSAYSYSVEHSEAKNGIVQYLNSYSYSNKYGYSGVFTYYYIPTSLRSVTITGDAYIPTNAFVNCDFLTEINLPENVQEIGSFAFYNCAGLTGLELPKTLTTINNNAVLDCNNMTDIYYHGTRSEYLAISGVDQFNDMTPHFTASGTCGENVTWEIDFDGTLVLDGEGAATGAGYIAYYNTISAVRIGAGVTSITGSRFTTLANNTGFTVDEANESLKSVDGMVLSKDGKTLYAVPVTATGTLTVPDGVQTVAASAAQKTKITDLVLPKSLKVIESNAFANTTLSSVTFGGSEDGWSMVTVASGNDQIHDVVCLLPNDPHVWDDGVVTTQPTCTEAGVRTFHCADCELTKTEEVPALGHDWSAEKQVITEATMTETGLRGYVCSRCHATKDEEVIPKVIENLSGDLNHDGAINMKDLLLFRQFLAGGYGVVLG